MKMITLIPNPKWDHRIPSHHDIKNSSRANINNSGTNRGDNSSNANNANNNSDNNNNVSIVSNIGSNRTRPDGSKPAVRISLKRGSRLSREDLMLHR